MTEMHIVEALGQAKVWKRRLNRKFVPALNKFIAEVEKLTNAPKSGGISRGRMTKELAQSEAVRIYGPTARVNRDPTQQCPYQVLRGDSYVGWGHSWRQALAGPCPHYKGQWPSKPVVIACVSVPESPFIKKEAVSHG